MARNKILPGFLHIFLTTGWRAVVLARRNRRRARRFAIRGPMAAGTLSVWFVDTAVVANPLNIVHMGGTSATAVYRAGGPSSDGVYVHVYARPGEYVVTLYVIDRNGVMSVVSQSVWIRNYAFRPVVDSAPRPSSAPRRVG